ncbi:uncharacterized protein LOC119074774 isoform X2 [Bradysia coprophila]|uniref:uncharacterized protein LOC119074774 isoform X2 n=1 Tax=Bradysia coprophila TaxID=38358 RepID=UPI00187DB434|nr:uncharacterized protein LOC119074774 isoform X2 [Bradysia coprophila]
MLAKNMWKKDAEKGDLYCDLFASQDKQFLQMNFQMTKMDSAARTVEKNPINSIARRQAGNVSYKNGDFVKAMQCYNDSLCLAPPNSDLVGIAYANRSACFLKLKMYRECLVDLRLAKEENYPNEKTDKLSAREAKCLSSIADQRIINDIGSKLSYDPDKTYPSVANVLNVEEDDIGNFIATAKEDIGVGKTIIVEKAFATYSLMGHNLKCSVCLKINTNLVPCSRCTRAMFCHEKCINNAAHDGECGLVFGGSEADDAVVLKEVRIILIVIDMFENANELMYFVQKTLAHKSVDWPVSDDKTQYSDFLKLRFPPVNSTQFVSNLYYMYHLALDVPEVSEYFHTEKHRRFLMHLLCLHYQITENNTNWSKRFFKVNNEMKGMYTHCLIGVRNRSFKVSCAPNVMKCDRNDLFVFITIRPIKKGEQLLASIYDYILLEPKEKRQMVYLEKCKTVCTCSRCDGISATSAQRQAIASDPNYQIVSTIERDADILANEQFVAFLNKYGHIPWCDELGKVVVGYMNFLRDKLSSQLFSSDMIMAAAVVNELL